MTVLPHLLYTSDTLVKESERLKPKPSWRVSKLDVKEFYLRGSAETLTKAVSRQYADDAQLSSLLHDVVGFLLDHQYVKSKRLPDSVFKVNRGTGIGLKHSGELTDFAFYATKQTASA